MNWYNILKLSRDVSNPWMPLIDVGVSDDPYKKKQFGPGTGKGFDKLRALQDGNIEGYPGDYTKKYNPGQFSETDNGRIMEDRPTDFDGEDTNNNDMKRQFEGPNGFYDSESPLSTSQQIMQHYRDNMKGVHNMGVNVPDVYSKIRGIYEGFN